MSFGRIPANSKKGHEISKDLFNQLSARFPEHFMFDRDTWPTFVDKGAKQGFIRESRQIIVTYIYPRPDEGFQVVFDRCVQGKGIRHFQTFEQVCAFVQENV